MEDITIFLGIAPSKVIFTRVKGLCNQGMTCCILWQHARVNFVLAFTSQICVLLFFQFLPFFSFIFFLSICLIMFNTFQPLNRLSRGVVNRLGARVWSLRVSRV
jgi:type III secretory pathway component EscV